MDDQVTRDTMLCGQLKAAMAQMEFIQSCISSNEEVNHWMREVSRKLRELTGILMRSIYK
jgi:hypothetical protein